MKDFDHWNVKKKIIHEHHSAPHCREREVWWCSLGVNVGDEQDGGVEKFSRPVVVLTKFNQRLFFGIPLSAQVKSGKYYLPLGLVGGREATAILSQARILDTKRLIRKVDRLAPIRYAELRDRTRAALFPL